MHDERLKINDRRNIVSVSYTHLDVYKRQVVVVVVVVPAAATRTYFCIKQDRMPMRQLTGNVVLPALLFSRPLLTRSVFPGTHFHRQ